MTLRAWLAHLEAWQKVVTVLATLGVAATCSWQAALALGIGPIGTPQATMAAIKDTTVVLRHDITRVRADIDTMKDQLRANVDALNSALEPLLIDLCISTDRLQRIRRRLQCQLYGVP